MDINIDQTVPFITDMLLIQAELNEKTNGSNYISKEPRTYKGKFIYYPICMKMEAAELLDSLPWKHWKYKETEYNTDNIKIEIIDILHFALSLHLDHFARTVQPEQDKLSEKTAVEYAKEFKEYIENPNPNNQNYRSTLFDYITQNVNENLVNDFKNLTEEKMEPYIGYMHYVDKLFRHQAIGNVVCIRELYEIILTMYGLNKMVESMPSEPLKLENFLKEVYNLYKAKLALNELRQDYGYNSGDYLKTWILDGKEVEDNVFIIKFISNNNIYVTGFNFYKLFKSEYQRQLEIQNKN